MSTASLRVASGVIVDEVTLNVDDLARACSVEQTWVIDHVRDGALQCVELTHAQATEANEVDQWRFASPALSRARRLLNIERTFDANPEVSALVVDLLEEVTALRKQLGNHTQ
jgi:chaperone modulatory protein CbpM